MEWSESTGPGLGCAALTEGKGQASIRFIVFCLFMFCAEFFVLTPAAATMSIKDIVRSYDIFFEHPVPRRGVTPENNESMNP